MSPLGPVLAGRRATGVHRADLAVAEVRAETESAGWRFAYVGGPALDTREAVMVAIGEALGFPAYFTGRSLDGLHDCLRDLAEPTVLLWDGWGTLAGAHPPDLRRLLLVLADRASEKPAFEVVLVGEGPADSAPPL
jgi:hypothetical protein